MVPSCPTTAKPLISPTETFDEPGLEDVLAFQARRERRAEGRRRIADIATTADLPYSCSPSATPINSTELGGFGADSHGRPSGQGWASPGTCQERLRRPFEIGHAAT
jgi:hypothetical protein